MCTVDVFCLQWLTLHCADSGSYGRIQRDDSVHFGHMMFAKEKDCSVPSVFSGCVTFHRS